MRTVLAPAYDARRDRRRRAVLRRGRRVRRHAAASCRRRILDRKVDALRAAAGHGDPIVASANPGCMVHLRGAGIDARHPADLLAEALDE